MAKGHKWQVWTENDKESEKQGHIVDEQTLFEGSKQNCLKFIKQHEHEYNQVLHLGYDC